MWVYIWVLGSEFCCTGINVCFCVRIMLCQYGSGFYKIYIYSFRTFYAQGTRSGDEVKAANRTDIVLSS